MRQRHPLMGIGNIHGIVGELLEPGQCFGIVLLHEPLPAIRRWLAGKVAIVDFCQETCFPKLGKVVLDCTIDFPKPLAMMPGEECPTIPARESKGMLGDDFPIFPAVEFKGSKFPPFPAWELTPSCGVLCPCGKFPSASQPQAGRFNNRFGSKVDFSSKTLIVNVIDLCVVNDPFPAVILQSRKRIVTMFGCGVVRQLSCKLPFPGGLCHRV